MSWGPDGPHPRRLSYPTGISAEIMRDTPIYKPKAERDPIHGGHHPDPDRGSRPDPRRGHPPPPREPRVQHSGHPEVHAIPHDDVPQRGPRAERAGRLPRAGPGAPPGLDDEQREG